MTKVQLKYRPQTLGEIRLNDQRICNSIRDDIRKFTTIRYLIVGPGDCCKTTLADCIVNDYYQERYSTVKLGEKWKYVYRFNMMNDLDWNDDSNEMVTFCKNQSSIKKTVIIDNFEKLTDQQQQIMKRIIDRYQTKTNFIFITNEIKLIKSFIQTRTKTILMNQLNRETILDIMKKICLSEKIVLNNEIHNHYIMRFCDKTISYYLNIINRALLIKLQHLNANTIKPLITDIEVTK
jgi:DNA polymerase III delta prime subunit